MQRFFKNNRHFILKRLNDMLNIYNCLSYQKIVVFLYRRNLNF